ncbi:MAG: UDP-N-acetylenolpyruvoylglucosamine reductase, partial [Anaerosomatales bacterium]|nr:UDP-N-acetylenolpyruvoylglucosamine reductase [Anaerosomatales bacterium]
RLIEACGLKGYSVGAARVSEVHANFVVNTGGATAADVLALIEHVREAVNERYGIQLETELRFLGTQV